LYAFFFLRDSGFCLKYSDEFIGGGGLLRRGYFFGHSRFLLNL
jgi:hypothetical protein